MSEKPYLELKMSMVGQHRHHPDFSGSPDHPPLHDEECVYNSDNTLSGRCRKDINILIGCKINGHIRFFALCQRLGKRSCGFTICLRMLL